MAESVSESATVIYLDNAATSFPKPECVYAAADHCLRRSGVFGRGTHSAADNAGRMVADCRQRLAELLNVSSADRLALTFNCTDGLHLLLHGILRPDDHVIISELDHNSVLRPIHHLMRTIGLQVTTVAFDPVSGVIDLTQLERELKQLPVRLVVLNHASNVTGVIQPVQEVARLVHDAGALLLLDAAQTAGHISLDVQDLGVDLLASAGHKGLLGPLGTGLVYVRPGLDDELSPVRCGGTGTVSESLEQPAVMPAKLESGNLNLPGIAGLNAAIGWLLERTPNSIHESANHLNEQLRGGLSALSGVTLYPGRTSASNVGIVSLAIRGYDSREAALILDQSFGIQCRAGLHCAPLVHRRLNTNASGGTIRFSPGPFTTIEEIQATIDAVAQIADSI
ncbi:MAG: aminotransferase class V-fold PLP-dependent enzyme [Planctomycetaceae bacterium]